MRRIIKTSHRVSYYLRGKIELFHIGYLVTAAGWFGEYHHVTAGGLAVVMVFVLINGDPDAVG
jgi:hypothetical protein